VKVAGVVRCEVATVGVKDPLSKVVELLLGKDFTPCRSWTRAADYLEWSAPTICRRREE